MTCPLTSQTDAYLGGELSPDDAARFRAHLGACGACAREVALAGRVSAVFTDQRAATCPPDVLAAALARVGAAAQAAPATPHSSTTAEPPPAVPRRGPGRPPARLPQRRARLVWLAPAALALALVWRPLVAPEPGPPRVADRHTAPGGASPGSALPERTAPGALPDGAGAGVSVSDQPGEELALAAPAARAGAATPHAANVARQGARPVVRAPRQPAAGRAETPGAPGAPAPGPALAGADPAPPDPLSPEALRARDEVLLAFSLIADANARAGQIVAEELSAAAVLASGAATGRRAP